MKQWKRDILLITAVLLCAVVLWLISRPDTEGTYAVITHQGEKVATYPLSQDIAVTIGDEAYNIITIAGGKVFVSDANCGDHTCIHTGKISLQGQQIVCLPHELIISVTGGSDSELDASTH